MASTQGKASKSTTAKGKAPAKQTAKAPAKQTAKASPRQTAKASPKQAKAPARRRKAPTHEVIAKRAYELSLAHGDGDHVGHWLQAERELTGP